MKHTPILMAGSGDWRLFAAVCKKFPVPTDKRIPILITLALLAAAAQLHAQAPDAAPREDNPHMLTQTLTADEGTVMFLLHVNEHVRTGFDKQWETLRGKHIILLRFPGLGEFFLEAMPDSIGPWWFWTEGQDRPHMLMRLPELPGPDTYHIAITWKRETGLMHLYINGIPTHEPQAHMPPWESDARADRYELVREERIFDHDSRQRIEPGADERFRVAGVQVLSRSLQAWEVMARCPENLLGRHNQLALGYHRQATPIDLSERDRKLVYENPLATPDDIADWVMEGPGRVAFEDGWLLRDTDPDKPLNHQVLWCPEIFPASFVAEWDVQILSNYGLCITFFCTAALEGQNVLEPALPPRDGTFAQYTHDALRKYHISYYSDTPGEPGRHTSNLRKNPGGLMAALGPIGIGSDDHRIHRIRLVKDGPHIQMLENDRVIIDTIDNATESMGGAIHGAGQIGFRQMHWTEARYRNFKVWELE